MQNLEALLFWGKAARRRDRISQTGQPVDMTTSLLAGIGAELQRIADSLEKLEERLT